MNVGAVAIFYETLALGIVLNVKLIGWTEDREGNQQGDSMWLVKIVEKYGYQMTLRRGVNKKYSPVAKT